MKKLLVLFIVICLTLSTFTLFSCGKKPDDDTPPTPPPATESVEDKEIVFDGSEFN